ncbi:MFS transporter [Sneathiella sp.]|uniref:MFS transporter n=1 Tax=Sneathiella sp. TaxID=1964365 RepID=UPI002631E106|nr:MFS transporter [Sneathiella sp.]MDF2365840.1 MFS transporter [Sneathiella sp.]
MSFFNSQYNSDAPYLDSGYSWLRLCISILISLIGSAGMWAVVVVLPAVQDEFAIDRSDASIPYTTTMIGFAVGNFIFGRLIDRFGIVLPMITASMMLGAGFALGALSTDIWTFAIIQGVLIGIGSAITFGPLIADISHWFEKNRGIAVAAAASGNYLAGTFWPLVLKDIIATDGWRDAYVLVAIASIAVMMPMTLLLRRRLPAQAVELLSANITPSANKFRADISPRTLQILLCIAGISCCVAMSMPQVHIVAYCADLGFGVSAGAEMLAVMLAGGIVSRLLSGFLADHIGGVRTVLLGSFLQCLALFLYIPFNGLASLYIVSLIFGLSQGGIVPSYAIIVREYLPAREAGERVGLVIMMTVVGMALGGWISGLIYDLTGSYQAAFINGIAWNMLNMGIMALLLWRTRESKPARA